MDVVAVEPGSELAALLAATYPVADLLISHAEAIDVAQSSFDLVVAATSIQWMDLNVVVPKFHRVLTPEGRLLVWRNVFGDPTALTTPFRPEVERITKPKALSSKHIRFHTEHQTC